MTLRRSFKTLRKIAVAVALVAIPSVVGAQITASSAFADAPQSVFPLLDRNTRLDMIDYFNNGMSTPSANLLNGKSRVTSITPMKLGVEMTDASTYEIAVLPAKSDTLVAVISTVATPTPDSRMTIYSRDFNEVPGSAFVRPEVKDWLTPEGKKNSAEVDILVPFMLVSYSYDPDSRTLTLTNNTGKFLSADVYEIVKPYLMETLTYQWDGSKFSRK